jgi:hypothetical protein
VREVEAPERTVFLGDAQYNKPTPEGMRSTSRRSPSPSPADHPQYNVLPHRDQPDVATTARLSEIQTLSA